MAGILDPITEQTLAHIFSEIKARKGGVYITDMETGIKTYNSDFNGKLPVFNIVLSGTTINKSASKLPWSNSDKAYFKEYIKIIDQVSEGKTTRVSTARRGAFNDLYTSGIDDNLFDATRKIKKEFPREISSNARQETRKSKRASMFF